MSSVYAQTAVLAAQITTHMPNSHVNDHIFIASELLMNFGKKRTYAYRPRVIEKTVNLTYTSNERVSVFK